ncbi:hypothetical protein BGX34_002916 [Mortierella sp. NVP85]|nr:hypothetical protein BGX34_002916 [Mortierella sp. NVP85]
MQGMPSDNPLEIPEIQDIVASFLDENDLVCCLCVSKSWREIFLPHRWRRIAITFEEENDVYEYIAPEQEVVYNHRYLVQELTINGPPRADDMCTHPNLRSLEIDCYMYGRDEIYNYRRTIDWDLTEKSPLLRRLSLQCVIVESQLCQRLSEHPRLRSLSLRNAEIKGNAPLGFLEACKNLESLSLSNIHFEGLEPIPDDMVFERMRRLDLDGDKTIFSRGLSMVSHCPSLESIQWKTSAFVTRISIHHPVQKNLWPEIDDLTISVYPKDTELASILNGIAKSFGMVELYLRVGIFGPRASKALGFHFSTLVKLNIHHSSINISSGIQAVLCSCPKLELLHARDIFARDVVQGGPWVCRQLSELKLCFRVGETEQHLHHLVFERLSTLVQLRTLDMGDTLSFAADDGVLVFRLDCGLGQLVTLTELTRLGFIIYGYRAEMNQRARVEDVQWMVDNWKKLKEIKGSLNQDSGVEIQLQGILTTRGVARRYR